MPAHQGTVVESSPYMANTARLSLDSSHDRMQVLGLSVEEVVPLAPATPQPAVTLAGHHDQNTHLASARHASAHFSRVSVWGGGRIILTLE